MLDSQTLLRHLLFYALACIFPSWVTCASSVDRPAIAAFALKPDMVIYSISDSKQIVAASIPKGDVRWLLTTDGDVLPGGIVCAGEEVYATVSSHGRESSHVLRLGPGTGKVQWRQEIPEGGVSLVIAGRHRLLVSSGDKTECTTYVLDSDSGRILKYLRGCRTLCSFGRHALCLVSRGEGWEGIVLDVDTLETVATIEMTVSSHRGLTFKRDTNGLVAVSAPTEMLAVDLTAGKVLWRKLITKSSWEPGAGANCVFFLENPNAEVLSGINTVHEETVSLLQILPGPGGTTAEMELSVDINGPYIDLFATEDVLVVVEGRGSDARSHVTGVDRKTGTVIWRRVFDIVRSSETAGKMLYIAGSDGWSAFIEGIEILSGETRFSCRTPIHP